MASGRTFGAYTWMSTVRASSQLSLITIAPSALRKPTTDGGESPAGAVAPVAPPAAPAGTRARRAADSATAALPRRRRTRPTSLPAYVPTHISDLRRHGRLM